MDIITRNDHAAVLEDYRRALKQNVSRQTREVIEEAMIGYLTGVQQGDSQAIATAKIFLAQYAN